MGGLGSSRGNASPQGLLSHPSDGAAPPRGGLAGGGLGRADVGSGSLMSTSSMREDSLIGQGSGAPEAGAEGASREQRPKRADSPSLHRVAKSASLKQDLQVRRRHAKTLDALMLGAERALGHRNSSGISSEALIEAFRGGGLLGSGGAQQAGGAAAGSQSGPEGMDLDGGGMGLDGSCNADQALEAGRAAADRSAAGGAGECHGRSNAAAAEGTRPPASAALVGMSGSLLEHAANGASSFPGLEAAKTSKGMAMPGRKSGQVAPIKLEGELPHKHAGWSGAGESGRPNHPVSRDNSWRIEAQQIDSVGLSYQQLHALDDMALNLGMWDTVDHSHDATTH